MEWKHDRPRGRADLPERCQERARLERAAILVSAEMRMSIKDPAARSELLELGQDRCISCDAHIGSISDSTQDQIR